MRNYKVIIISLEGLTDIYECDLYEHNAYTLKLGDVEFEGKYLNMAAFVLNNITGFYVISQKENTDENPGRKSKG